MKTKTNKMTLILKKRYSGYYENKVGNITITIAKCGVEVGEENGSWEGIIIDGYDTLVQTFGLTKKEVVQDLTNYIQKNF